MEGIWVRRVLVRWCVPEGDAGEKEVGESNLEAVYIQKRAAKLTKTDRSHSKNKQKGEDEEEAQ